MKKRYLISEKGITLIELLATLSIFFIISSLIYSVFINTIQNTNRVESHNQLRNEVIIVVERFNNFMGNVVEVKTLDTSDGKITKLRATQQTSKLNTTTKKIDQQTSQHIIEIREGDLLIDGEKINSNDVTFSKTRIYTENGFALKFVGGYKTDSNSNRTIEVLSNYEMVVIADD